jgi:hypothetical protein
MLDAWQSCVGQVVVLDMQSPFVCAGTLVGIHHDWLLLEQADMHDLRDTSTTREVYVVELRRHGVTPNRRQVWLNLHDVIALSRLEDVIA